MTYELSNLSVGWSYGVYLEPGTGFERKHSNAERGEFFQFCFFFGVENQSKSWFFFRHMNISVFFDIHKHKHIHTVHTHAHATQYTHAHARMYAYTCKRMHTRAQSERDARAHACMHKLDMDFGSFAGRCSGYPVHGTFVVGANPFTLALWYKSHINLPIWMDMAENRQMSLNFFDLLHAKTQ